MDQNACFAPLFYAPGLFCPLHNPVDLNRLLDLTNCHTDTNHTLDFSVSSGELPKTINTVYIQVWRHAHTCSHSQEYAVAIYIKQINTYLQRTSQDTVSLPSLIYPIAIANAILLVRALVNKKLSMRDRIRKKYEYKTWFPSIPPWPKFKAFLLKWNQKKLNQ